MRLTLIRVPTNEYTPGVLYINDERFCDTLEDFDRDLTQDIPLTQIKKIKIKGDTCIPYGTYKVVMTFSPKFKKTLPLLEKVPGFAGIRIHAGNTTTNTDGCILVGESEGTGQLILSRVFLGSLIRMIERAIKEGDEVVIYVIKQSLI